MELQTKYITLDEFKDYFGIDLRKELGVGALGFLVRQENLIASFLNARFRQNIERHYPTFSQFQKYHYKLAILEQCYYVLRNSDISSDSGYDPDKGVVAKRSELNKITLAPNTLNELLLCGLCSREIKGSRTFTLEGYYND